MLQDFIYGLKREEQKCLQHCKNNVLENEWVRSELRILPIFSLEFLKSLSLKGLRYGSYNGLIKGKIL